MRIMFLLFAIWFYSFFVRFFDGIGSRLMSRTDEAKFCTLIHVYQTLSEKQTGIFSRSDTVQAIYTMCSTLQPPDCVSKWLRYRTYSTEVTSFSRAISRFIA